ncbi:redoxin domain-containing protein [Candidatus Dependentiae bacterium]|nr:redoxin domain-containing protein [Candidatus Dependentiae bacterium]
MKKLSTVLIFSLVLMLFLVSCNKPNPEEEYKELSLKIAELKTAKPTSKEEQAKVDTEIKRIMTEFIAKFPNYEKTADLSYELVEVRLDELKKAKPSTQFKNPKAPTAEELNKMTEERNKIIEEAVQILTTFIKDYPDYDKSQDFRYELRDIYSFTGKHDKAINMLDEIIAHTPESDGKRAKIEEQVTIEKIMIVEQKLKAAYSKDLEEKLVKDIEEFNKKYPDSKAKSYLDGIKRTLTLRIGSPILEYETKDIKGVAFSFKKYKGKVLLLDFWATWCAPCVHEMPNVLATYNKFHKKGFDIIGVSFDSDLKKMKEFIIKEKMSWCQIADGKGWNSEFGKFYNIRSIPSTYLIDRKGVIRYMNLRGKELEEAVDKLIKEK